MPWPRVVMQAALTSGDGHAWNPVVENAEALLRALGHAGHVEVTAHERDPRLLGKRLKLSEISELPLIHFDLGHLMIQHPTAEHGQSRLLGVNE